MTKSKGLIATMLILIIVLVGAMVIMFNFVNSEAKECLASPLTYGVGKVAPNVDCTCRITPDNRLFKISNLEVSWVENEEKYNPYNLTFIPN